MSEVRPVELRFLPPDEIVGTLIEQAAQMKVSDLFLTADEDVLTVSARHLGVVRPITQLPAELGRRCLAHIKAMAGLDMTERRRPLDGRWIYERDEGILDLRLNTIPTLYGEDMTLRLLDRSSQLLSLEQLGLLQRDFNQLLSLLNNPSGLILVTGPTGSGKTTTLYAGLNYLNNGQRKINTIEDPVEYSLRGVRQSQVNVKLDVGFVELLRAVLRQAPDVIMIGEIRDPETAEVAVRAANSGHLVLATLHAPIAAGAIQSLLALGVHPHFLASSLRGVIAQRLIRTLCPECKVRFDLSDAPHTFDEIRHLLQPGEGQAMYGPRGCPACLMSGYASRTGVFEVMTVTREVRRLVMEKQPLQVIRRKAAEEGTVEFRQAALLKVARGETAVEEVFRAVPSEYINADD